MSLIFNDLAVVLDELHDVRKMWYEIGLRLQVSVEDLETISSEHKSDQHSLRRVILLWLKSGTATWAALCEALSNRTVGEVTLAGKLRERYCKGVKENSSTEKRQINKGRAQNIAKVRAEPLPEPCRKSSQDLSNDTMDTCSLDSDIGIIDVGSPSCEQYRAGDKTPTAETKKRSSDSPVIQSESKKANILTAPDSYAQDDFAKSQPTDRECTRCNRVPNSPVRSDCCKTLYCKPCSSRSKVCLKHEGEVEFLPDCRLRTKVQRLMVKCRNYDRCGWKGMVKHLKYHLPECTDFLPNESATHDEDKMTEDDNLSFAFNDNLPSPRVSSFDHVDMTPVSNQVEEKTNEARDITVAAVMGGVKIGSDFNDSIDIEGDGGEKLEISNIDTNCHTPPLNLIMTFVSKYQASTDKIWLSSSFLSHQLGYKLCLMAKILPKSRKKLNDSIRLEVGIVSAQGQQDNFLKFPCIGDAKVKVLNPHQNKGHKEISMGFVIHNGQHNAHTSELSYPMVVPKEFIFKDRLFFHVVMVQLSEDHRPWLLDPSQVTEDTAYSSDSESECNNIIVC